MGRGRYYTPRRRRLDDIERSLFGSGWAARLAFMFGLQGRLRMTRHNFVLPGLQSGAVLRLAFASDFHAGPLTDARLLSRAIDAVADFSPDLVLYGGDYASLDLHNIDALLPILARLKPRYGSFGVFGNHDLWLDEALIAQRLRGVGVEVLLNEHRSVHTHAGSLHLYGMDDPCSGEPSAPTGRTASHAASIILMHAPSGIQQLAGTQFDLALCGHTHGGQIALPGGIPLILPAGTGDHRYARGEFALRSDGGHLIVSRGIGMGDLPVRLFAPSEVHLCTLSGR